ncbi:hypothetical protein OEA41_001791 [Lepraria neglecta]|uniref:RRM domain-containing protein n=1 Tax=Lepraria neglecta TaxID=209136 RepID=A0AAD9ZAR3_9LECA|nr:hypothetical protein OEA41_001791 [Lepraria neglecta]
MYGNMQAALSGQTLVPSQVYQQMSASNIHHEHRNTGMDNLADSFGNINLRNAALMGQGKAGNAAMQMNDPNMNAMMGQQSSGPMLYQLPDGTFMVSGSNTAQGNYHQYPNAYNMAVTQPTQYQQAAYHGMPPAGMPTGPHAPRNHPWTSAQSMHQIPELIAPRRSSWSSNEEASPQTPLDGYQPAVVISGHSPTTWSTTPSPIQAQFPQQIAKDADGVPVYADFWAWTQKDPAIPPPVPAVHSGPDGGRGTLDKILDNRNGTTNVYIRGLQPNTTDEMLGGYGARFGPIVSQKAIIEMSNNTCKGYGFIMYHNYNDAENCIRAFFFLGYEAKFAKESHNQRLKALGDKNNTNLYVSNLPRMMVEKGLETLIQEAFPEDVYPDHQPTSTKILKDSNGISRGVGFARFQTPEICQQIIDAFNNKTLGEGKMATTLQIRYADTEEQKKLKTYTAEKRLFKTNEYNEIVYGPGSPWRRLYSPVSNSNSSYSPIQIRAPGSNVPWSTQSQASSISPPYVGYPQAYPHSAPSYGQASSGLLQGSVTNPTIDVPQAPARHTTRIKIESPSVTAAAKKAAAEAVDVDSPDGASSSTSDEDTLVCKSKSSKSCREDVVLSPTKSKH